jgi:predicted CoA-binding protein
VNVAVVGASDNPERMSHRAVERLAAAGHRVFPVHPKLKALLGLPVYASLETVPEPVDTITLYVGPEISSRLEPAIRAARPRRVIFNPGAENPPLAQSLSKDGVETLEACTLVLLSTKRF